MEIASDLAFETRLSVPGIESYFIDYSMWATVIVANVCAVSKRSFQFRFFALCNGPFIFMQKKNINKRKIIEI